MDRFTVVVVVLGICFCFTVSLFVFVNSSRGVAESEKARAAQDFEENKKSKKPTLAMPGAGGAFQQNNRTNVPGPDTVSPFKGMSDEEKNTVWWEIASAALIEGKDPMRLTLDLETAGHLARKYGSTNSQLMQFFRSGAQAAWRKDISLADEKK